MDIEGICTEIRKQILAYRKESDRYGEQIDRGNDVLESSRAQSFSDGAVEALTEVLQKLEDLKDVQQSTQEWGEDSEEEDRDSDTR